MENSPNSMVESRQEFMVSINKSPQDAKQPSLRTAHFLKPSSTELSSSLSLPSLLPDFDPKKWPLTVNFHGWRNPTKHWKEWVEKMAFHAPTWEKAGILDAILNSTYEIHKSLDLVLGVTERWCPDTKSFIFPWGEATVTLEDMLIAGYSVSGSPVFKPLETDESKAVEEALVQERKKIISTSAKKAYHYAWLKVFMDSGSKIEHEAFLTLWLSRFVLPTTRDAIRESVFPIAIHLARGTKIALAPVVLSTIYRDLSLLKQKIVSLTTLDVDENVVVTTFAPFQLVSVWVWERFMKLSPKPNLLKKGEPRLAQWKNVKCSIKNARSLLDSSIESFNWRPYTKPLENWDFPKFYRENEMWVYSDSDLDDDLLSFVLCLRVSELVGLESECIQQYLPHRVARQFGFDQDLPGFVVQSGGSSKNDAWSHYIRPVGDFECFIPSRFFETDVTTRYLDWWNTLEFHQHSNLVTDVLKDKKKAEASLNSGKKRDDGDSTTSKSSKILIEEMNNLSVPPGFLPKRDRVDVGDSDSSEEDKLTISRVLKSKKNQDVTSNRQCGNRNNLSSTQKRHSSPSGTKFSAERVLKSNDDGNLTPSQSRSHSCSGAFNGILRGLDQVAPVEAAEDENVRVEFGERQSHPSSVAGNDQTRNDLEVIEATVIAENVKMKEKQDAESANNCATRSLVDNETNNINGYSFEAASMELEYRIQRLEKINAEIKALLCGRYSGTKRARV